ncbi:hypothetical protein C7M84_014183 [Penaeus vannamei]|uniref:Uncharacterized protein n=1 Tax=Penaeus vannamei TaxID=6689 RepID=A0A3R7LZS7_PENVA|nr:hypothetical protein C7M84_014183 [Penaeus vannamei]
MAMEATPLGWVVVEADAVVAHLAKMTVRAKCSLLLLGLWLLCGVRAGSLRQTMADIQDALLSPSSQRYSVYVLPPATHQDSLQKRQADFEADDAREDFTARPEGRRGAPRPDAPPAGFLEVSQGPGLFGGAVREGAPFFITDFDPELQPGWGHEEELEDKMDSYAVDPTPGSSSLTISGDGLREAEDSPRHSDADKDAKVLKKLLEKPKKLMKVIKAKGNGNYVPEEVPGVMLPTEDGEEAFVPENLLEDAELLLTAGSAQQPTYAAPESTATPAPMGGMPYEFGWVVDDEATANFQTRQEKGDKNGVVTGCYQVLDPNGLVRTVTYRADKGGFRILSLTRGPDKTPCPGLEDGNRIQIPTSSNPRPRPSYPVSGAGGFSNNFANNFRIGPAGVDGGVPAEHHPAAKSGAIPGDVQSYGAFVQPSTGQLQLSQYLQQLEQQRQQQEQQQRAYNKTVQHTTTNTYNTTETNTKQLKHQVQGVDTVNYQISGERGRPGSQRVQQQVQRQQQSSQSENKSHSASSSSASSFQSSLGASQGYLPPTNQQPSSKSSSSSEKSSASSFHSNLGGGQRQYQNYQQQSAQSAKSHDSSSSSSSSSFQSNVGGVRGSSFQSNLGSLQGYLPPSNPAKPSTGYGVPGPSTARPYQPRPTTPVPSTARPPYQPTTARPVPSSPRPSQSYNLPSFGNGASASYSSQKSQSSQQSQASQSSQSSSSSSNYGNGAASHSAAGGSGLSFPGFGSSPSPPSYVPPSAPATVGPQYGTPVPDVPDYDEPEPSYIDGVDSSDSGFSVPAAEPHLDMDGWVPLSSDYSPPSDPQSFAPPTPEPSPSLAFPGVARGGAKDFVYSSSQSSSSEEKSSSQQSQQFSSSWSGVGPQQGFTQQQNQQLPDWVAQQYGG